MDNKTIVVLATLDTKGTEARYLADKIEEFGHKALLVDTGVIGVPGAKADITREEVSLAGGTPLSKILESPTRELAASVMVAGATKIVLDLARKGEVHGIVSLGGTQGTSLSTEVMRALPYGFPKLMVSTMASGNVAPLVDIKDVTMMFSVTDILGLNPVMSMILGNAAGAVCGMASMGVKLAHAAKPLVAVTNVGITTRGAMRAVKVLEEAGYETIVFHAIGPGGRAMEQMMKEGLIGAVLDFATIEVSNEMYHALLAGGPERLTTAGKLGLPQVICPGAIEILVYNEPETVPAQYQNRRLVRHTPKYTDLRLNKEEMRAVGEEVARRLQYTTSEAVFLIPTGGYDCYAVKGQPLCDTEADAVFVETLRARLPKNIRVVERDTDIESPAFADESARTLIQLIESRKEHSEAQHG